MVQWAIWFWVQLHEPLKAERRPLVRDLGPPLKKTKMCWPDGALNYATGTTYCGKKTNSDWRNLNPSALGFLSQ
jgi:hypothetical protein